MKNNDQSEINRIEKFYKKNGEFRWLGNKDECLRAMHISSKCGTKQDFLYFLYFDSFSVDLIESFKDWPYEAIILSLLFFYIEIEENNFFTSVNWTQIFSLLFNKKISHIVYQFIENKKLLTIPIKTETKKEILAALHNVFLPYSLFSDDKIEDLCLTNLLKLLRANQVEIHFLVEKISSTSNLEYLFDFINKKI